MLMEALKNLTRKKYLIHYVNAINEIKYNIH